MTKKSVRKVFNSLLIRTSSFKKKTKSRKIQFDTIKIESVPSKEHQVSNNLASYMISEILQEIFDHLADTFPYNGTYDLHAYSNLFSCILVNRHWCRNAIITLWRQPFHPCLNNGQMVVNIYLSFLEEEERNFLLSQGINNLPSHDISKNYLFDYPTYFKHLHQQNFYFSIENWCQNNLKKKQSDSSYLLMNSLLRLFYKKSGQLEIFRYISPVQQLTVTGTYENNSGMILLSKLCTNVRELCIENFSTAKNIDHIIKSQNNLVSLEITNLSDHSTIIIQSILSQSKSLRRIKFYKINFSGCCEWNSITLCKKLQVLEIYYCMNLSSLMILPLINTKFHRLKRVKIMGNNNCEYLNRLRDIVIP
ncbi:hypothetical protein RclHR1_03360014 [Rhizophagus clarus]|uniref:F-box domain-containing protein n=1 Tax=Rhizophagus clarus TaxID=94130 RepID=A0A2Z6R971_9GLOM|nr:hypothetical protein RclHR1_03360014 [Rhizophagus clarus]GES95801.1 hypothetical protein GLOIN_2v1691270 [Rhizophagus clarus]